MKRVVRRPAILLLSVLTTLLLPPAVARGQDWTLSECIEQALRTSPQIQATAAERDAAAENLQEARASRYPLVGLTASTSYLTETMSLALPGMDSTPGRRIQFGDGSTSDLMLGAHVPLFTGGALAATLQERAAGYQARTMDLRADTLAVRTQVRQAFFLALGLQEQATAIRQGQLRLERRVQEISHDIDAGLATEAMRLEALSRLRKAEQATLQADADAAAGRFNLGRLVGHSGQEIQPDGDLGGSLLAGHEAEVPMAMRPQIRSLEASAESLEHTARAVQGAFWPAVNLEGGWHYGRPGVDLIADDWMDYGSVAVRLSWTLWDWGVRRRQIQSVRAREMSIRERRSDLENDFLTRRAIAASHLEAASAGQDKAAERVELENRRLELTRQRVHDGHASASALLDSQDDLTLAEVELAASRARLRLAEVELLDAMGY